MDDNFNKAPMGTTIWTINQTWFWVSNLLGNAEESMKLPPDLEKLRDETFGDKYEDTEKFQITIAATGKDLFNQGVQAAFDSKHVKILVSALQMMTCEYMADIQIDEEGVRVHEHNPNCPKCFALDQWERRND